MCVCACACVCAHLAFSHIVDKYRNHQMTIVAILYVLSFYLSSFSLHSSPYSINLNIYFLSMLLFVIILFMFNNICKTDSGHYTRQYFWANDILNNIFLNIK